MARNGTPWLQVFSQGSVFLLVQAGGPAAAQIDSEDKLESAVLKSPQILSDLNFISLTKVKASSLFLEEVEKSDTTN